MAGAQALGALSTASQICCHGAGLEVEQPVLEPVLIWDVGITGGSLIYYTNSTDLQW